MQVFQAVITQPEVEAGLVVVDINGSKVLLESVLVCLLVEFLVDRWSYHDTPEKLIKHQQRIELDLRVLVFLERQLDQIQ